MGRRLILESKGLGQIRAIWCGFCSTLIAVPITREEEDMDKAMLLSQLALAVGFLVFIVRALGERVQELSGN